MQKNIELRRHAKGLYEVVGVTHGQKHVFLTCADNRNQTKRDFGWRVCEGRTHETATPVSDLFDRRGKAEALVLEKISKSEYVVAEKPEPVKLTQAIQKADPKTLSKEELIARHNAIAEGAGYTPIKTWNRPVDMLVKRVERMETKKAA